MTAIADAELQRLFAAAINEQQLAQGIVNTAHDAFCAALNERLEAAERLERAMGLIAIVEQGCGGTLTYAEMAHSAMRQAEVALAAYRQSKEQP